MLNNPKNRLIIFNEDSLSLEVKVNQIEDTVWLNEEEIANLFEINKDVVIRHINSIYLEKELDKANSSAETIIELKIYDTIKKKYKNSIRKIKYYNLDLILLVGYRVKSKRAIMFRKWANNVLREYAIRGSVINNKINHDK